MFFIPALYVIELMLRKFILPILVFSSCSQVGVGTNDTVPLTEESDSVYSEEKNAPVDGNNIVFKDSIFVRYREDTDDSVDYKLDTIVSRNPWNAFLAGTTVLPSTGNQLGARRFDIYLERLIDAECVDDRNAYGYEDNIYSVEQSVDSLIVKIKITANCCYSFLGDIGVANDSTLNLIFHEYGSTHCACDCIHELVYIMSTSQFPEENRIDELKAIIINSKPESIKLIDK